MAGWLGICSISDRFRLWSTLASQAGNAFFEAVEQFLTGKWPTATRLVGR